MTLQYPDVSNYQGNMALQAGTPACFAKASDGTGYADPYYAHFKAEAARVGALFGAYHFLRQGNAAAQARFAYSIIGSGVPTMIDFEPVYDSAGNAVSLPSMSDATVFRDTFRGLGGLVSLNYLPKWYWAGHLGSPSLAPLADLGLVSSDYTAYSDTGPGWDAYGPGEPIPAIWQYTDAKSYSGQSVDFNAFRGTVAELEALLFQGGSTMNWTDIIHGIGERVGGNQVDYILTDLGRFRDRLFGDTSVSVPSSSPLAQLIALPGAVAALGSSLATIGKNVTALSAAISGISTPMIDPAALAASVKAALADPTVLKDFAHALAVEAHNDTPSS